MLNRKQTKAIKKFIYTIFKQFWQLSRTTSRKLSRWLVRNLLNIGRRRRTAARAGFVLPTVVMLLLVVALVVAALLFRTGSRTDQVMGAREEQVIYNAATPAIERAKAKLEYLFRKDKRFPSGPPSDEMLLSMLTNRPSEYSSPALTTPLTTNPYNLNRETELGDINGDGKTDPAWSYPIDVDGDGNPETVVYSITLKREEIVGDVTVTLEHSTNRDKANALVVRNGPINLRITTDPVCAGLAAPPAGGAVAVRATNENDWFAQGSATLRKTFQVDAIVISNKAGTSRTVATLEFQQDRQIDRGNKWGAWFRYDLEIFPGASLQWNGAMYTAGNLMIGNGANFTSYLISAPKSCFYRRDASEIRVNQTTPTALNPRFMGQIVAGQMEGDALNGRSFLHVMKPDNSQNTDPGQTTLDQAKDSVSSGTPSSIALDPVVLFTTSTSQSRGSDPTNTSASLNDTSFDRTDAAAGQIGYFYTTERIVRKTETPPFIDDTYRADDRYGPKPAYGSNNEVVLDSGSKRNGQNIQAGDQQLLTNNTVDPLDTEFRTLGWDGYWERRASLAGLRVIVGERLELGNPYGWEWNQTGANTYKNDPLYPSDQLMLHGDRQRRTLRDNLAAVQATAVYHVANPNGGGNVPIACLATTSHPGTQVSIDLSKDFSTTNVQLLNTNFFTGKGTNGWEYAPPPTGLGGNWDTALRNLGSFAGEIDGAFPPLQEAGRVHPNPFLTMWGNFSNLRRAMEFGNNSIADNTYKYTAACTMGILAQNMVDIQTPARIPTSADFTTWASTLQSAILSANSTAENYIVAISPNATDREKARNFSLSEQIRRDREFGFAPIPTSPNPTYAKYQYQVRLLSSAATPTSTAYTFGGVTYDAAATADTATTKKNLALSCDVTASNYFGLGNPPSWTAAQEQQFIRLAVSLCSSGQPKFPSLYYLFPTAAHGRNSVDGTVNNNEPYIQQTNAADISVIGENFAPLNPSDIQLAPTPVGNWRLPHTTDGTGRTSRTRIVKTGNNPTDYEYVSLLDTAFYNGREMMTVRTLDVDLNLLRSNSINGDTWLPTSGIVYAFREDAVREDAIARPGAGAGSCSTNTQIITSGCQTKANHSNGTALQDPALTAAGISPKPVDYYADPDRRPHGFRLFNGKDISRSGNKGLSFISDNPVYIQGDFNLHSTDGNTNNLEEFTQTLDPANWEGTFYNRTTLNANFARPATDRWRPSEILGDAVTILSNNFTEGNIAEGITNSGTPATHSFRAMNGPSSGRANNTWVREDGTTSNPNPPIKVSRNGKPLFCATAPAPGAICTNPTEETSFRPLDTDYAILVTPVINTATPTRVNAMIISGITPSGQGLSYGGIQNFPRYIENWLNVNQFISGAFLQLNFSTYATGPFRQNAWEPGTTANGGYPKYYSAPLRRWGYDVGLQYAPAAPVAQRLGSQPSSRSEFYKDLRADDFYICKLRLAVNRLNGQDPASRTECN